MLGRMIVYSTREEEDGHEGIEDGEPVDLEHAFHSKKGERGSEKVMESRESRKEEKKKEKKIDSNFR